jgi:hypothetical protein
MEGVQVTRESSLEGFRSEYGVHCAPRVGFSVSCIFVLLSSIKIRYIIGVLLKKKEFDKGTLVGFASFKFHFQKPHASPSLSENVPKIYKYRKQFTWYQ